ncbi:MAG: DUF6522 family protein [Silicimonas sp.]|uniref:DUF6522 family protein n=1 Tax=Roseovarius sp. TaxID=1486281 RepID=UPI0032EE5B45
MSDIEKNGDRFTVDAHVLSETFDLSLEETKGKMRGGHIVSLCESGEGEDAGLWRLTFRYQGRALRLTVDADGNTLSRSTFPVGGPERDPDR